MAISQLPSGWWCNTSAKRDVRSNGVPSPRRPDSVNVPSTSTTSSERVKVCGMTVRRPRSAMTCVGAWTRQSKSSGNPRHAMS